jgi:adenylate cyclase
MSGERVERRLAAILAADVAGYSRLMGADEEGTHERVRAHLAELVEPKIREHRGRTVKNTGDGLLAEFPSVVDAVRCAAEVQRGMAARNVDVPADKRIEFRIGINLGDIIIEDGDIFGDGVNVAARLEALAEPGGVCVSGVVHDQVRDKLDLAFEDMGDQQVKNIARPVRAYAFRPEGLAAPPRRGLPSRLSWRGRAIVAMSASLLAIACLAWWLWPASNFFSRAGKPADQAAAIAPITTEISPPLVAPRLSIVVLPFANLSSEAGQQYFVDGITEGVTTDLSRIEHMLVISRDTAFTYKEKPIDPRRIGRELGVRYVLEGSVQRSGDRLRINVQLIDAETGTHLWAERFDRDISDLFALQDEITTRIANEVDGQVLTADTARPTAKPDVLDYILRGWAAYLTAPSRRGEGEAIGLFEHALVLDPGSVEAQSALAIVLAARVRNGLGDAPGADLARADQLAKQALTASPASPLAHLAKGQVLIAQHRYEDAIPELEVALAGNPNYAPILYNLGQCKLFTGAIDEAIPLIEKAIRISPQDRLLAAFYFDIARVNLLQDRTDQAILWLEKGRSANPGLWYVHAYLASAFAIEGQMDRAAEELAEARKLVRDDRLSSITRLKAASYFGVPKVRALFEATYIAGLRKAGMPEE